MKKLLLVVSIVAFVVPATASAKGSGGHKNAAKECKAMRAEMGADAFRAAFGGKQGKHALGRCVSTQRKARKAARKRARKACRAEGLRGQAMKRCIRAKLASEPAPRPADYQHAVDECRAEQAEDPEGFADEFGDDPNAFGKCVADEAKDEAEADEPEGDEVGEEPDSDEPEDSADEPAGAGEEPDEL
jgi:hypothetical protein